MLFVKFFCGFSGFDVWLKVFVATQRHTSDFFAASYMSRSSDPLLIVDLVAIDVLMPPP